MSGPKVFHVVTREELVARCEVLLRQLDAAIAEWMNACKGAADPHETKAVVSRREGLQKMLEEGRFSKLQEQARAEILFLQADAEARIERAAVAAARAMQNQRRAAHTARMLLEALGSPAATFQTTCAGSSSRENPLRTSKPQSLALSRSCPQLPPAHQQLTGSVRSLLSSGEMKNVPRWPIGWQSSPHSQRETFTCGSTSILPNFPALASTRHSSPREHRRFRANIRFVKRFWRTVSSLILHTPLKRSVNDPRGWLT